MTKVTLSSVGSLRDTTTAQTTINANNATIVTAFDNTLSRDGTSPNTMSANLDMNSNRILNLPAPISSSEPARFIDVVNGVSNIISVTNFGASPAATASVNAAAFTAAAAYSPFYNPAGNYSVNTAGAAFTGRWFGPGIVTDSSANKRASLFSAIGSTPSYTGSENSIETAFNGDFSLVHSASETRITGTATLGQPATGYTYSPAATPFYSYLYNASGWNQSTSSNVGRTAATLYRAKVYQAGQGDAVAFNAAGFVTGAKAGATDFLANPAVVLYNGDLTAGSSGTFLNSGEFQLNDNGFDVAGIGWVVNANRTVNTGALGVFWSGFRAQGIGTVAGDSAFSVNGLWNTGLDLTPITLQANNAGITMKADTRIYGSAVSSDGRKVTAYNTDYLTYSSGLNGWHFVRNNTSALQIYSDHVVVPQSTASTSSATGALTVIGGVGIGGNGYIAGVATLSSGTATPAGGSTAACLLLGTTSGFGIYYGSGVPTVSAASGSIYIRTDNAGANLRLYSNTTGSTTWAAITSA